MNNKKPIKNQLHHEKSHSDQFFLMKINIIPAHSFFPSRDEFCQQTQEIKKASADRHLPYIARL